MNAKRPVPPGPKMAAFIAVSARLKAARESGQGISLKAEEVEAFLWGLRGALPTAEEREWLSERRRGGN